MSKNKILLSTSLILLSFQSYAKDISALGSDNVIRFIEEYSKENKYTRDDLIEIFARVKITKQVKKASKNQPEVRLTWGGYKSNVINQSRILNGKKFIEDNFDTLKKAEKKYFVPKEIITAIIGIESSYGKNKGNFKAINALSTMAFEGGKKRQTFFKKELIAFLDNSFENKTNPLSIKSSWAGALGYPQFIPSSIKHYAVDFNNDGKIDIINSVDDTIGSIANYLNKNGWIYNNYIAEQVEFKGTHFEIDNKNKFELNYTVAEVEKQGFEFKRNMRKTKSLKLFKLEKDNNIEFWVGYNNFKTITKYNKSNLYAMAIFSLANQIKGSEVY